MYPMEKLRITLDSVFISPERTFFTPSDLRSILPELSAGAFRALLFRATQKNILKRVCRGLYTSAKAQPTGLELYHIAARLRAHELNYISLETALSDAGLISQIPMQWITLMSSGRTQIIDCGDIGHIEFIHTKKKPENLVNRLNYDIQCHLWRADIQLAIDDMKRTQRNMDLIQ